MVRIMALPIGDTSAPEIPRRRHVRNIVSRVRVNFTLAEARMLGDLQKEWDLPLCQIIRILVREEHRRSFGRTPAAFPELEGNVK